MFKILIEGKGYKYHDDKKTFYCPKCGTAHIFITYQDKKCDKCGREIPDISILMGKNERLADTFFKELEKC